MNIIATLVKFSPASERPSTDYRVNGDAAVYKLATPLTFEKYDRKRNEYRAYATRYIWISTVCLMGEWETYAFACYSNGKVHEWTELYGSMRHDADCADPHAEVLDRLGYERKISIFHADHGVSQETLLGALRKLPSTNGFFLKTLPLDPEHAPLSNKLYGPACGDESMRDESIVSVRDANDKWRPETPFVSRPIRQTNIMTVIGMLKNKSITFFTAYGGPAAQRVPNDPSLKKGTPEHDAAVAFWRDHALAAA